MSRTSSAVRVWRAWYEDQPEPTGWPITANSREEAAATFVRSDEDLDADEIKNRPVLVFVRRSDDPADAPARRIRVTAVIETTIWGYPEYAA